MKYLMRKPLQSLLFLLFVFFSSIVSGQKTNTQASLLTYEVNPQQQTLRLYWKDDQGNILKTFPQLKTYFEEQGEELVFAMNGGMFMRDYGPLGLYIEKGKVLRKLNQVQDAYGNFYLQPNGVFYLTKEGRAGVCQTSEFQKVENVYYATQSGPMLLINGKMHPAFNEGSPNKLIRNAVGVLPNGNLLFVMSKKRINFFDFASFFMEKGCQNALYLDGVVSRTYLPEENWKQLGGRFGVMIGVAAPK